MLKNPLCSTWPGSRNTRPSLAWYAKEKGWDKEEGLDFQLHFFDSGMAQMEALPAKQWVIAGMGGVPANVGALRYGTVLFAIGNDESETNCIMVRADSPILKTKGFNPKYPRGLRKPRDHQGKDHPGHHGILRPFCHEQVARGFRSQG